LALANLVAAANVLLFDRLAGFGGDELLLQPISGFLLIRLNETRSELDAALLFLQPYLERDRTSPWAERVYARRHAAQRALTPGSDAAAIRREDRAVAAH
jgi:hypothetical protein